MSQFSVKFTFVLALVCVLAPASPPARVWYERVELPLFGKVVRHGEQSVPMGSEKPSLRFWRCGMYSKLQSPNVPNYAIEEIKGPGRTIEYSVRNDTYYGEWREETLTEGRIQRIEEIVLLRDDIGRIFADPLPSSLRYVNSINEYEWDKKRVIGVKQHARYVRYGQSGGIVPLTGWEELDLVQGSFILTVSHGPLPFPHNLLYVSTYYQAPQVVCAAHTSGNADAQGQGFIRDQRLLIQGTEREVLLRCPSSLPAVRIVIAVGPSPEAEDYEERVVPIKELEILGTEIMGGTLHVELTDEEIAEATTTRSGSRILTPPGPGEVRLVRGGLTGGERNTRIPDDGWIYIGRCGLRWHYTGGTYLSFAQEGVSVYVGVDDAQRQLAGIWIQSPGDDLTAAAAALEEHPSGRQLILWCECPLPEEFSALPGLDKSPHLRRVRRGRRVKFSDLSPLANLTSLTSLDLRSCDQVTDLRPLAKLVNLESLELGRFPGDMGEMNVHSLSPLAKLAALRSLDLSSNPHIGTLSALCALPRLEMLDLRNCRISDLKPLAQLTTLKSLNLHGCEEIVDVTPLAKLTNLESLAVGATWIALDDLSPLAGLTNLRQLELSEWREVSDLTPLTNLTGLESLILHRFNGVSDISPLAKLTNLKHLNLESSENIQDLSPLSQLKKLESLSLTACRGVSDLSPLAGMAGLTRLSLHYCSNVSDIEALKGLGNLRTLSLEECMQIQDLTPLSGLTSLRSLYLNGCNGVQDLSPLRGLLAVGAFVRVDERLEKDLSEMRKALPK